MEESVMGIEHWTDTVTHVVVMLGGLAEPWDAMDFPERCARAENELRALLARPSDRGAVEESRMLRRILQATQEYLLLAPDDSVDYDALLTRVRSALGGR